MTSYPMSFEQTSIWLNDRVGQGGSRYRESWAYRLRGPLEPSAVEAALTGIVRRHEGLRSRLELSGAGPVQTVLPPVPVRVPRRTVPADRLSAVVAQLMAEPLPLDTPPLLRATLLDIEDADDEYVLAVVLHHAAMDGASLRVLDTEFSALYRAALDGRADPLPALPRQIGPHAQLRHRDGSGLADTAAAHWRAALQGAPAETALPGDRPRPPVLGPRGGEVRFVLDQELTGRIARLARQRRSSPQAVLVAALTALTHRLTGGRDLVLGVPVSLRDEPDLDPLIACLTEVLPVRQRIDPGDSFAALVDEAQLALLDTVENRNLPFTRLLGELGTERTLGRFPLFQIVLNAESTEAVGPDLPGITAERLHVPTGTAKYDLFCNLTPQQGRWSGVLEYAADLYDHDSAVRLVERYRTLLADGLAHPGRPLADLALLPEAEERAIRAAWTAGRPPLDPPLVHELFAEQARRTPDAPAVALGEQRLTYGELEAATEVLAARLVEEGYAGRRIAVCVGRSLALPQAVLAVLRAGATCVPVDPAYPAERIDFMLRDSGAAAVLTDRPLPTALPAVSLDALPAALGPLPTATPDDLCYVLYTSGSTGTPKGVAMPHRSIANLVAWQRATSGCGEGSRTLQFAPLSFDVAFQEMFATWACGGCLVLADDTARTDPERLCDLLVEQRVDRLFLPYVALRQLAEYACATRRRLPRLREVITAGEQLYVTEEVRRFFAELTDAVLENQYGPTETHVVTAERLTGSPALWPERPPIGRPVAGARVHVLDDRLRPAPVGAVGELCVAGPPLAVGYLERPRLTAERFLPDPYAPPAGAAAPEAVDGAPSGRLYRTGDLARLLPDGRIDYLGRRDDQVKIRGHRVELGEVEAAVKALPQVRDAVVVTAEPGPGAGHRLVAGYVGDGSVAADELRAALAERLPKALLPSAFLHLPALPLTHSGKVDRAAVARAWTGAPAGRPTGAVAPPRTVTEQRIADHMAGLLSLPGIGADEDFFRHGGDSLLAVRLVLALRAEFGARIPMNAVFAAPTVGALGALVDDLEPGTPGSVPPGDLRLPADVRPGTPDAGVRSGHPEEVVLTGATGFLGAFLLRDLLAHTTARVHCLVRGGDREHAEKRLRAALEEFGLWDAAVQHRITVHRGDLAAPRLGLGAAAFDQLARRVDAVYHCGAQVNLAQAYAQARDANVTGTVEVLRLAAVRNVPVHHISTAGVFAGPGLAGRRIGPREPLGRPGRLVHGYTQSKWVAEQLVEQARRRDLSVSVYRPTRVCGAVSDGACQRTDFLWLLLKGCVQLGLAPALPEVAFDLVPVDYVSRAVVALSGSPQAAGRTFHLASERLLPLGTAVHRLRERGYALSEVPVGAWLRAVAASPGNAAFPLLGAFGENGADEDPEGSIRFDATDTRRLLAGTGVDCPEVDGPLFDRYLSYFRAVGFLPGPGDVR
ncbi:amino acid adenylation domain-containing protein [Streptomyces sp. NPDC088253]|uniref:non-ribosomal peptide synthetase n=1 Tax=Streptomyces sp. NPDC088253 TaxID=3365846 RepID=UPI00382E7766